MERAHQAKGDVERDVPIGLAVDKANGAIERNDIVQHSHPLARFPKASGKQLRLWSVGAGFSQAARHLQFSLLFGGEAPIGEVRRRGNADQRLYPLTPLKRDVERDPAAHRGANENERAVGQSVDSGKTLFKPQFNRSVLETTAA